MCFASPPGIDVRCRTTAGRVASDGVTLLSRWQISELPLGFIWPLVRGPIPLIRLLQ